MFEKLEQYYNFLEKDISLKRNYKLSNYLTSLRDKINDDNKKKICSYELYFNDFNFDQGKCVPLYSDSNGQSYPNMELFDDNFDYLISRAVSEDLKNPKYKAKYNHLIWESPRKHIDYAKAAIDNYFLCLTELALNNDQGISMIFENLFILSQKVNYKKNDSISLLIKHLPSDEIDGFQKYSLMDFIYKKGKKIDNECLKSFFDYSNEVISNKLYPELEKEYLSLLILLCVRLEKPTKDYLNKLGESYIIESKKYDESFVVHDYYLKALNQYQKAGNKEKVEEVTILIDKAKDKLNFKSIKSKYSSPELQKLFDSLDELTTNVVEKGTSKDIYDYLIHSEYIFPKAEILDESINSTFTQLFSTMNFDINRNVSGSKNKGLNSYNIHIQNFSINHLWLIFNKGVKSGKISFESLKDFLYNNAWFGQNIYIRNINGEKEKFNWLDLILPSLKNYFIQSEIDLKTNKNNNAGYILSIDSLVLKFEGILRDFSRQIGAQTIDINGNGTQERISFEKLLENKKIKEIVPKDDLALFKFLFTSDWVNLRNNIAHCFYKPTSYSASIMWLLICVFLKLGNYTVEQKSK